MNDQEVEFPKDPFLAGSVFAMQRAALRARLVAHQTGSLIVVYENGRRQYIRPVPDGDGWIDVLVDPPADAPVHSNAT